MGLFFVFLCKETNISVLLDVKSTKITGAGVENGDISPREFERALRNNPSGLVSKVSLVNVSRQVLGSYSDKLAQTYSVSTLYAPVPEMQV